MTKGGLSDKNRKGKNKAKSRRGRISKVELNICEKKKRLLKNVRKPSAGSAKLCVGNEKIGGIKWPEKKIPETEKGRQGRYKLETFPDRDQNGLNIHRPQEGQTGFTKY